MLSHRWGWDHENHHGMLGREGANGYSSDSPQAGSLTGADAHPRRAQYAGANRGSEKSSNPNNQEVLWLKAWFLEPGS